MGSSPTRGTVLVYFSIDEYANAFFNLPGENQSAFLQQNRKNSALILPVMMKEQICLLILRSRCFPQTETSVKIWLEDTFLTARFPLRFYFTVRPFVY